jgi:DNA repair exonuclease SbcCD ATPase subunit
MKISDLSIEGFCGIGSRANVAFPQTGLVLVTGRNGYGKSTLIESVSHAVWGEGVFRTGSLWADKGTIELHTHDGSMVHRQRAGSRTSGQLYRHGSTSLFDTATKMNEAAATAFGSHDAWRTTHIIEPSDAAMFTRASDTVRKHVLEGLLGLSVYDDALVKSRTFRKAADRVREDTANKIAEIRGRLETLNNVYSASKSARSKEELTAIIDDATARIDALQQRITECDDKVGDLRSSAQNLRSSEAVLVAKLHNIHRVAVHGDRVCPLCGSTVGDDVAKGINDAATAEEHEVKAQLAELREKAHLCEAELSTQLLVQGDTRRDQVAQQGRQDAARRELDIVQKAEGIRERMEAEQAQLDVLNDKLANSMTDVDLYATAEKILGVRGVRAHILDNAVNALGHFAAQWMSQLSDNEMSVSVQSYTENTRGDARNAISISLLRGDRTTPYAACSRGEQRRIDIAVTLALADIQSSATAHPTGTLFVDEIMDGLDYAGALATLSCLAKMAAKRCVVVITHKASVQLAAKAAAHFMFVAPGVIERAK